MATIGSSILQQGGTPWTNWGRINTVPGTLTQIFQFTVPAASTRTITKVAISCDMTGCWELSVNDVVEVSGRTAPGHPDSFIKIPDGLPLTGADIVKLKFKARSNSPIVSVDGFIGAIDT